MLNKHRWWLTGLTLILALMQIGAVVQALNAAGTEQIGFTPPLEPAAGVVWALLFALAAVNLVRKRPRALRWACWIIGGFVIYSAGRLILFAQADYDRNRLTFIVIVTTLLVVLLAVYAAQQTE